MNYSSKLFPVLIVVTLVAVLYHAGTFDFKKEHEKTRPASDTRGDSPVTAVTERSDAVKGSSTATQVPPDIRQGSTGNNSTITVRLREDVRVKNDIALLEEEAIGWSDSGNMAMMELAVRSLAARGKEAIPALIELLLRNPHHPVILGILDELQDASTFPLLREAFLKAKTPRVMDAFLRLMATNPSAEAMTFLVELFKQQQEGQWSHQLIYALSRRPEPASVDVLLDTLLGTKHLDMANVIINSLSDRDDPRVEQVLLDMLTDAMTKDSSMNPLTYTLLGVLSRLGDQNTAYRLLELLPRIESTHRNAGSSAFYLAIGHLMGNEALPVLAELADRQLLSDFPDKNALLNVNEERLFQIVSNLLVQRGQLGLNSRQLNGLVGFLAESKRPEASRLLIQLYNDPTQPLNRPQLLDAIASTRSPESLAFLADLVQSPNPEYIRWTGFNALKERFGEDASPILANLVGKQDQLSVQAYDALMAFGGPTASEVATSWQKRIVVQALINESQAASVGLQPGDVILSYDRHEVHDAKELQHNVTSVSRLDPIELEIERNGALLSFVIEGGGIGIYMQETIKPR